MNLPKQTTSKADFKYYKTRVAYWMKKLDLGRWDIEVVQDHVKLNGSLLRGFCSYDISARNAVIGLGEDWGGDKINHKALNSTALHEVLELALAELMQQIYSRSVDENQVTADKHSLIHEIMHVLLGPELN